MPGAGWGPGTSTISPPGSGVALGGSGDAVGLTGGVTAVTEGLGLGMGCGILAAPTGAPCHSTPAATIAPTSATRLMTGTVASRRLTRQARGWRCTGSRPHPTRPASRTGSLRL